MAWGLKVLATSLNLIRRIHLVERNIPCKLSFGLYMHWHIHEHMHTMNECNNFKKMYVLARCGDAPLIPALRM